jgi:hypothetical protein
VRSQADAIRQAYGAFDGRLPTGITLIADSPEQWDVLTGRQMLSVADVERLAQHDRGQLFSLLSFATTIEHETRHVHDFMLSRIGSDILAARLSVVMNAVQALYNIVGCGDRVNALPLPLTKWIQMSPEEQDTYLNSISRFVSGKGVHFRFVGPKLTPDEPIYELLSAASRAMQRVETALTYRYPVPGGSTIGLMDVAEASALVVQAQSIWTAFGRTAADTFISTLTGQPATMYGRVLKTMLGLHVPLSILGILTTWALVPATHIEALPARFVAAATDLAQNACPENVSARQLFNRWDMRFGTPTVDEVMRQSLNAETKVLAKRREDANTSGSRLAVQLADYYEAYISARRKLVDRFLAEPDRFTNPFYYQSSITEYVEPVAMIVIPVAGVSLDRDFVSSLEGHGFRFFNKELDQSAIVVFPAANPTAIVHSADSAREMMTLFALADAIASRIGSGEDLISALSLKETIEDRYHVRILRLPI